MENPSSEDIRGDDIKVNDIIAFSCKMSIYAELEIRKVYETGIITNEYKRDNGEIFIIKTPYIKTHLIASKPKDTDGKFTRTEHSCLIINKLYG